MKQPADSTRRRIERRKDSLPIPFEDRRFLDRRRAEIKLQKDAIVPRYSDNYNSYAIDSRLKWLEQKTQKACQCFADT